MFRRSLHRDVKHTATGPEAATGLGGRLRPGGWEGRAPERNVGEAQRLAEGLPVALAFCSEGRVRWANGAFLLLVGCGELPALCGTSWAALFEDAGAGLPDPRGLDRRW